MTNRRAFKMCLCQDLFRNTTLNFNDPDLMLGVKHEDCVECFGFPCLAASRAKCFRDTQMPSNLN